MDKELKIKLEDKIVTLEKKNKDADAKIVTLEEENKELEAKMIEIYTLYNISRKLQMVTQLDEIFTGTMELIGKSLQIDDFCIMLVEGASGKLVTGAYHGDDNLKDITFEKGEGISGKVALTGKMALIQDVKYEPDFLFYKGRKKDIGAFICIPLCNNEKKVIGLLNAHKITPNSFIKKDVEMFQEVANQIAIAIEKAKSYMFIKELSTTDELTKVHNRRYFFDFFEKEMERAKRYDRKISLIMIDVDDFKSFNDKQGHIKGDYALRAIAASLQCGLRKTDILARYGGEEFIILLPETDRELSFKVAEKLRDSIHKMKICGEEQQPGKVMTITLGISTYPNDAKYATELLNNADKALYFGKSNGKNVTIPYDEKLF